jgi:hypothetical protein
MIIALLSVFANVFLQKCKTAAENLCRCYIHSLFVSKKAQISAFVPPIRPCWQIGLPPPRPFKRWVRALPKFRRSPFRVTMQKL